MQRKIIIKFDESFTCDRIYIVMDERRFHTDATKLVKLIQQSLEKDPDVEIIIKNTERRKINANIIKTMLND